MPLPESRTVRLLIAVAAEAEARAVLAAHDADPALASIGWTRHRIGDARDLVVTGVGKANASGAVARTAGEAGSDMVVSLGVGGALPGSDLCIGDIVVADRCVFADEGLASPDGFEPLSSMGFACAPGLVDENVPSDVETARRFLSLSDATVGAIATVSTCSGTDERAAEIAQRTGAVAEAMEGAAVGLVAHRLGLRFAEVRVISNTTGRRQNQIWDLPAAFARFGAVLGRT